MSWWRKLFRRDRNPSILGEAFMSRTIEDDLRRRAQDAEREVKWLKEKADADRLDALERAADPDGLTYRERKVQDAVDEHGKHWVRLDLDVPDYVGEALHIYTVRTSWKGVLDPESGTEYSDQEVAVKASESALKQHGINHLYRKQGANVAYYGYSRDVRPGWDVRYDRPPAAE